MCPTVIGRIETRVATLLIPALLATLISVVYGDEGWIVVIGLFLLLGVALDVCIYQFVIRWQPPWLTGALAVYEFVLLYLLVKTLQPGQPGFGEPDALPGLADWHPIFLYWLTWCIAISTKIVVLPLVSLSWIEDGGEFRHTTWTIRAQRQRVPVIADVPADPLESAVVREFAADVPNEAPLQRMPSLAADIQSQFRRSTLAASDDLRKRVQRSLAAVVPESARNRVPYVHGRRLPTWEALILMVVAGLGIVGIAAAFVLRAEPRSRFEGFVYVESNLPDQRPNSILAYHFHHNRLRPIGEFPTGGFGTVDGGFTGSLDAQGQIAYDGARRLLLAVNQGSDTIAVFHTGEDGRLTAVPGSPFSSHGLSPAAIGVTGDTVVVTDKAHDPHRNLASGKPRYVTFRIGSDGALTPTGRSWQGPLYSSPTQALPVDGRFVLSTEETGPFRSLVLHRDGSLTEAPGSPLAPDDSAFDDQDGSRWGIGLVTHPTRKLLYADQARTAQLFVYSYDDSGRLTFRRHVKNSGAVLPCWTAITRDGRFLFTANAGNGSVSAFSLADPARPRHLQTVHLSHGANPWGLALDPAGKTLFVVDPRAQAGLNNILGNRLHVLTVGRNGHLTEIYGARMRLPVPDHSSPLGIAVVPG